MLIEMLKNFFQLKQKIYGCILSNKVVTFKKYLLCTLLRSRLVQTCDHHLLQKEAVAQTCSVKRCSQKFRKSHRLFSCEFREISQNTFFYRTPLVAASLQNFQVKKVEVFHRCFSKQVPLKIQQISQENISVRVSF